MNQNKILEVNKKDQKRTRINQLHRIIDTIWVNIPKRKRKQLRMGLGIYTQSEYAIIRDVTRQSIHNTLHYLPTITLEGKVYILHIGESNTREIQ